MLGIGKETMARKVLLGMADVFAEIFELSHVMYWTLLMRESC